MDLAAARHSLTDAIVYLNRTSDSHPAFSDDLLAELMIWLRDRNSATFDAYPERFLFPVVSQYGSDENFYARVSEFKGQSDHVELLSFGIPTSYFSSWPFEYLGTTRDSPEVFDATQLKRLSLILGAASYWIASASGDRLEDLAAVFLKHSRICLSESVQASLDQIRNTSEEETEVVALRVLQTLKWKLDRELHALEKLSRLAGREPAPGRFLKSNQRVLREFSSHLENQIRQAFQSRSTEGDVLPALLPTGGGPDLRVPRRVDPLYGPISQSHLQELLGRDLDSKEQSAVRLHPYFDFEILNFVDGKRNVEQIRQALSAQFGFIPADLASAYLEALEEAGIITWEVLP